MSLLWVLYSQVLLQIVDILKQRLFRALGTAESNWESSVIRNYDRFLKDEQNLGCI